MSDIIAFEESCENAAGAESVRFERNEDQNGWGQRVVVDSEVFVEF